MQVNSSNGSLATKVLFWNRQYSVIHLPDFNDKYIFSKKKSGVSDKEYRKQIREQAMRILKKGSSKNKSEGI